MRGFANLISLIRQGLAESKEVRNELHNVSAEERRACELICDRLFEAEMAAVYASRLREGKKL